MVDGGGKSAIIFEHMLACCIAVSIEVEYPPETSVPRPTWIIEVKLNVDRIGLYEL